MVKNPLTLAKQENKQTKTPQWVNVPEDVVEDLVVASKHSVLSSTNSQKQTQPNTDRRQASGEGETIGEKEVKRPKHS